MGTRKVVSCYVRCVKYIMSDGSKSYGGFTINEHLSIDGNALLCVLACHLQEDTCDG